MTDAPGGGIGPRRHGVPDLEVVADQLLNDLDVGDDADDNVFGRAELHAMGTLTGFTEDDLVAMCILLTRRLLAAQAASDG
jgi:hypothetical protein